jgi:chorismate-pyruvate lyase
VTPMTSALRRTVYRTIYRTLIAGALLLATAALTGCARVHQKDREFLSDPVLQRTPDPLGESIESHNLPRREGSSGGSSGSGGGCGC